MVLASGMYFSIKTEPSGGHLVIAVGCAILAFTAHRHAAAHPDDSVIRRCYQGAALLMKLTAAIIVVKNLSDSDVFPHATPSLTMGGAIMSMTVARRLDELAHAQHRNPT